MGRAPQGQSSTMDAAHTTTGAGIPLSVWSQTAPRDWVSYALCFPMESPACRPAAEQHLRDSLTRLEKSRPKFAGRLRLSTDPAMPGRLCWVPCPGRIDADFKDISAGFGATYQQLRGLGFDPCVFANPNFRLGINPNPVDATQQEGPAPPAGNNGAATIQKMDVPAVAIRGFFIDGGLFLLVFLHHAFGDGVCMRTFLDDFAAETRGEMEIQHADWALQLPDCYLQEHVPATVPGAQLLSPPATAAQAVQELVSRCPEYRYCPGWTIGPTQPVPQPDGPDNSRVKTDAKIFVLGQQKLAALRRSLQRDPDQKLSDYVCLSALTWAHITRARYRAEGGSTGPPEGDRDGILSNPVNWKSRVGRLGNQQQALLDNYYGNATAKCLTTVPAKKLVKAAAAASSSEDGARGLEDLRGLDDLRDIAAKIRASIDAVDVAFVAMRTRLYEALPDPRSLGLVDDPGALQDMQFNTWQPFGADAKFRIPGVGDGGGSRSGDAAADCFYPERIRKVMMGPRPDFRNVIIMPAREGADAVEVFVSLPSASLMALCEDRGFMRWVDKEVG